MVIAYDKRKGIWERDAKGNPSMAHSCQPIVFLTPLMNSTTGSLVTPQISVIINLYNNHLDHHLDFNNYNKAKLNILKNQKDGLIITHNSLVQEIRAINKKIPVIYTDFVPDLYPNESYILQESNQDLVLINLKKQL